MILLPYDLTFRNPVFIHKQNVGHGEDYKLESKNGLLIKVEYNNITSCADVSPLEHLNTESYKDVHIDCKKINTTQIFSDIDSFLSKKENEKKFEDEKFLDFDFSPYTQFPSVKHALSCLFSDYYRQKLGIKISGQTYFHGLIPNSLIKAPVEEAVKKAVSLEKIGFKKAKLKIGSNGSNMEQLKKENELLLKILTQTKNLKLRLDANKKFQLQDYKTILSNVDLSRIDYVEEPVEKSSELIEFSAQTKVSIAIDENISLLKDVNFKGVKAVIIKPTVIGDYFTIKRITNDCKKRGITAVLSSSLESQVGIYQIAQLAHSINAKESHGLDTFDCFLEQLMDIEVRNDAILLKDKLEIKGPIYV